MNNKCVKTKAIHIYELAPHMALPGVYLVGVIFIPTVDASTSHG